MSAPLGKSKNLVTFREAGLIVSGRALMFVQWRARAPSRRLPWATEQGPKRVNRACIVRLPSP